MFPSDRGDRGTEFPPQSQSGQGVFQPAAAWEDSPITNSGSVALPVDSLTVVLGHGYPA